MLEERERHACIPPELGLKWIIERVLWVLVLLLFLCVVVFLAMKIH